MKIANLPFVSLVCFCCSWGNVSAQDTIRNFAGGGIALGDNGPATAANVTGPATEAFDSIGNFYFFGNFSNPRVRRVDSNGIIRTVAGNGTPGFSGDNGPATAAEINPQAIAVDKAGNIYIGDYYNNRVRKVDIATGKIHTIAGTGIASSTGDGGPATLGTLMPLTLCLDKFGNLYVHDSSGVKIRKIDTSGIITTIAGNGIGGNTGNGGAATAAEIIANVGLCTDRFNNLYIGCDAVIRKVDLTTGIISAFAGTGFSTYNGDEIRADTANFAEFGLSCDDTGNLYVADYANNRIRKIDTLGFIYTVAGDGVVGYFGDNGPATAAEMYHPEGLSLDACGNLYISDEGNNHIRKVTFNSSCDPYYAPLMVFSEGYEPLLTIYPNPACDKLKISSNAKIEEFAVFNIFGQEVYNLKPNQTNVAVIISGLTMGIYLVRVLNDEGVLTVRRFVKE